MNKSVLYSLLNTSKSFGLKTKLLHCMSGSAEAGENGCYIFETLSYFL